MDDFVVAAWSMAGAAGGHLAGVSLPLLVAGLALHTLKLGARARAWQNVLRASFPERRVEFRDAAIPYFAATAAGVLIPFGGGEVLRIALARTRLRSGDEHESASTATIVGSLAAERVLDVAGALLVVALAVTAGGAPAPRGGGRGYRPCFGSRRLRAAAAVPCRRRAAAPRPGGARAALSLPLDGGLGAVAVV